MIIISNLLPKPYPARASTPCLLTAAVTTATVPAIVILLINPPPPTFIISLKERKLIEHGVSLIIFCLSRKLNIKYNAIIKWLITIATAGPIIPILEKPNHPKVNVPAKMI